MNRIGSFIATVLLLLGFCSAFVFLYSATFKGELMPTWTHGPFNMDHGNYLDFIRSPDLSRIPHVDKANKHPLVAVVYNRLGKLVATHTKNEVYTCSITVGLALLVFGGWLYWRTSTGYALLGVALMGGSFAVWFNGAVLEARSAILLGAAVLLIGIDLINRYPGFPAAIAASLLTIPLLGFCVPNVFLSPLAPLTIILKAGRIGPAKAVKMLLLYVVLTAILVIFGFYLMSTLNPAISLDEFVKVSQYESGKSVRCELSYLTLENFKMTARQYLICSLAGLPKPPTPIVGGPRGVEKGSVWLKPNLLEIYAERVSGILFMILYGLVLIILTVLAVRRSYLGDLFWVLLIWIGIDILFFTYFNPSARSPNGVEVLVPIWAIILLGFYDFKPKLWWILFLLAVVIFAHNLSVFKYLRDIYP